MKQVLGASLISLSLFALTACGKPEAKEQSETSGFLDNFRRSSQSFSFNLSDYIAKKADKSVLTPYAKSGTFMLGNKSSLAVENNLIVEGSQAKQNIVTNYYLKGHALNRSFSIVDANVTVSRSPVGASYKIDVVGDTKQIGGAFTSEINYKATRDFTIPIPGSALQAIGFYGSAGVGGEVKIHGIPALDAESGALNIRLNPSAKLYSKVEFGAAVAAGIGKAGLEGVVTMFEAEEPMYASLGLNSKREVIGRFVANGLEFNAMGGKVAATVTVGVNDLLPTPMQSLWKKYLEKQWKWDILSVPSTQAMAIQGTDLSFGSDE